MFESASMRRLLLAAVLFPLLAVVPAHGDEVPKKTTAVPIRFVPPPLENATYSVGIYEVKSGKLVRRLCEAAAQGAFTVGLNGLITSWDGKDDDGKTVPPGKYAARGYAVGAINIEGTAILGNDWAEDDENLRFRRVDAVMLLPNNGGIVVLSGTKVARYGKEKYDLLWQNVIHSAKMLGGSNFPSISLSASGELLKIDSGGIYSVLKIADGTDAENSSFKFGDYSKTEGKNGTHWEIMEGVVSQHSSTGERLRSLASKENEPLPEDVIGVRDADKICLIEEKEGWQRVRGLSWVETKEENGKSISTWQTFFERNIRTPDSATGLENAAVAKGASPAVEITLSENPLSSGKPEHLRLTAAFDNKGSYLSTSDGLRLRQVSQRNHVQAVKLMKDTTGSALTFFQSDGAAWDEFSIKGTKEIVSFDAGEFEMSADGEKLSTEKPAEPDL